MGKLRIDKIPKLRLLKSELTRFLISYKFALDEMNTKINILQQEFQYVHDYNPIEHVKSRLKSPESILRKVYAKGCELSLTAIKENVQDIAGIRITCSFLSDVYKVSEMLQQQKDIKVIKIKDYIKEPKPNGYRSLHLLMEIPVFMSDREENVCVEVQIRTIAMDFWASLEHKIYYKYGRQVPQQLLDELKEAAEQAAQLDEKMEHLSQEVDKIKKDNSEPESAEIFIAEERFFIPPDFIQLRLNSDK